MSTQATLAPEKLGINLMRDSIRNSFISQEFASFFFFFFLVLKKSELAFLRLSANQMAVAQTYRYRSGTSVNVLLKYQNGGKILVTFIVAFIFVLRWAGLSITGIDDGMDLDGFKWMLGKWCV